MGREKFLLFFGKISQFFSAEKHTILNMLAHTITPNPFVDSKIPKKTSFFAGILRKMCIFAPKVGWKMCVEHAKIGMKMCFYV